MIAVPKQQYLFRTISTVAETASLGLDFGEIYKRSVIGVRVYGVPAAERAALAAYFRRINEDYHQQRSNTEYHRGQIKYDYLRLNCAKTSIGAAFRFGAGYRDLEVTSARVLVAASKGSFRIRGIYRNVCSSYLTMSKRLTSIDIANLAGVSQTTVSRVLQDLPSVKPETKARVLKVIQDNEYSPSAAARQMKTRRSGTVAVVIASLSNPLYPMLLQLLVERLASRGFRTTVWELEGKMDEATVRALAESATDGVIFAAALDESREMLTRVAAEKPIILINRSVGTDLFDTIVSDNYAGGRRVADYFVSAGRKCIGLISAASSRGSKASTIRERERGFMEGLGELSQGNAFVRADAADFGYESGFRAMQTLLAERPAVDAVFCTNDIVAIGVLDAARRSGKQVPNDIWIVGYDDIPMARWECISLSTVQQPLPAMVELVVDRLQRRMTSPELAPHAFVLPNDLVLRRTTS